MGHEGECRHLHGHNYIVLITAEAPEQDKVGRVIDFSVLKQRVGRWIEGNWDHGFIFCKDDGETASALDLIAAQKRFALPSNPTAENMAAYLLREACPSVLADTGVRVTRIVVWETESCYAEATL